MSSCNGYKVMKVFFSNPLVSHYKHWRVGKYLNRKSSSCINGIFVTLKNKSELFDQHKLAIDNITYERSYCILDSL